MLKKMVRTLALGTAAALLLAGPANAQLAEIQYEGVDDLPDIKLTWAEWQSPVSPSGAAAQAMADYITAASKGKITVEIYWSASLMTPPEQAAGIGVGLADFGLVAPVYTPTDFPVHSWLQAMGTLGRGGTMFGRMAVGGAYAEFMQESEVLAAEFAENNLVAVSASTTPPYSLLCNKPMQSLADFSGKRARTAGQVYSEQAGALGMVPVPIQYNEMYEALSRGIIDCVILHVYGTMDMGLTGIPGDKYYVHTEFPMPLTSFIGFNKDKWESLPPVAQSIIKDGLLVHGYQQALREQPDMQEYAGMIDAGEIKAIQPDDDVRNKLVEVQDQLIANLASTAPAGVENPQAIVDSFRAYIEKWQAIVPEYGAAETPVGDYASALASWQGEAPNWAGLFERLREELKTPGL